MAVDDASTEGAVRHAGGVDLLAGEQRTTVVDERAERVVRTGKTDRQRVVLLPRGVGDPIFVADPDHFRRPEIGDMAALRGPLGLVVFGEDEALVLPVNEVVGVKDREGIGRIVRCRQQVIAAVGLQHRGIAVAGEDARRDIVGQQRLPR